MENFYSSNFPTIEVQDGYKNSTETEVILL